MIDTCCRRSCDSSNRNATNRHHLKPRAARQLTFLGDRLEPVERVGPAGHVLSERQVSDGVRQVELARRERLHVVHCNGGRPREGARGKVVRAGSGSSREVVRAHSDSSREVVRAGSDSSREVVRADSGSSREVVRADSGSSREVVRADSGCKVSAGGRVNFDYSLSKLLSETHLLMKL